MKNLKSMAMKGVICLVMGSNLAYARLESNQTPTTTPILPETTLPFSIIIEKANFELPVGLHSGMFGEYKGLWVFIAGKTDGLHGFGPDPFLQLAQNSSIFVVDPSTGVTYSRALSDSDLTQKQIDSLTVVSPQGYQDDNTLYMTGGYGFDTEAGTWNTKPVLTAFYLPGIVQWVMQPSDTSNTLSKNIQQIINPVFQVTGGEMLKLGNVTQLVFGQNFDGVYTPGSNGDYTNQVRQFQIGSQAGRLSASYYPPKPALQDPAYRRRDLNVVPVILNQGNKLQYGMVGYGGVFTLDSGVWTVPVVMDQNGTPSMADPNADSSFKQGMNQYVCANTGLYSRKSKNMYSIFFGGISFGFYSGGTFSTDTEIPFINQVTTIAMDQNGSFSQYLMDNEYPVILSTTVNPGNQLLFGAGAYFIRNHNVFEYPNGVLSLDHIRAPTVIGYIVGGIASTLPNTNTQADSFGSKYVFKVTLVPKD